MRGRVAVRARFFGVAFGVAFAATVLFVGSSASAQSSTIGATVCTSSSTITITSPESDSIVTQPSIQISGEVRQASQIEIQIDEAFDSVIPLDIGQTEYESTVQLPVGTHTIGVVAVNMCPGSSGTATVVVTYEKPPSVPSTGGQTDTSVGVNGDGGGVTVDSSQTVATQGNEGYGFFDKILEPLQGLAGWLNINTTDVGDTSDLSTLSTGQAVALAAGFYLAIIGLAPSIIQVIASVPFVASALPAATLPGRVRLLAISSRVIGLLLIIGTLLFL